MDILMLSPLPPPTGGIATWTTRFKEYYNSIGFTIRIVNISLTGDRAEKEVLKRNYFDEIKRTIRILKGLTEEMKKKRPDVVHINTSCATFGMIRDYWCQKIAKKRGIPVVLHCHCNVSDHIKNKYSKIIFNKMIHYAQKVIVLNKNSLHYIESLGCKNALIIPNFIDEKNIVDFHAINDKMKEIVYVGHIEFSKGVKEIFDIAEHFPDLQFTLVGPVRQSIETLKKPNNVMLVGKVSNEDVSFYLKRADAFLFLSKSEGFSVALLEAMAAGLPIVATDVGANRDMIEDDGGIIVPVGDENSAICALNSIQSFEVRQAMSIWNINKVKSQYLINDVLTVFIDVYSSII